MTIFSHRPQIVVFFSLSYFPPRHPLFLYFITAKTAFHNCTFSFITAHFVHHCTLKQALLTGAPSWQGQCIVLYCIVLYLYIREQWGMIFVWFDYRSELI